LIKTAFIKQAWDLFGPWRSMAWDAADPLRLLDAFPGKATLWEMSGALEADWYIIPQRIQTEYIYHSAVVHPFIGEALRQHVSGIVPVEEIPFERYDVVISFDPVLLPVPQTNTLFAYFVNEHWDRFYAVSLKQPLFRYDLFLAHMLDAEREVENLPGAVAFPYMRQPALVRSLFPCQAKEEGLWLEWRTIAALATAAFWDETCVQAAEAFQHQIGVPLHWKVFGATPFGVENPPRWGDGRVYLNELARCKYYAAIGRISGAGQGLCDAASLDCICFGEANKAYHRLVCHPACLCNGIKDLQPVYEGVAASTVLQAEILAWQRERLYEHFYRRPLEVLQEALETKRRRASLRRGTATTAAVTGSLVSTLATGVLEEAQARCQGIEEKFAFKAVLYVGSEAYNAQTITLLEGLQELGFTVYTLFKPNINSWFCNRVLSSLRGVGFDFVVSDLHWGTRWEYYDTFGLLPHLKVLLDGDDNPHGVDWQSKLVLNSLRYPDALPEIVKLQEMQPFRWMEAHGEYKPDVVFAAQKSTLDEGVHYLPFGIQREYATWAENRPIAQREIDFAHIRGAGTCREHTEQYLADLVERRAVAAQIFNAEARGEVVFPQAIAALCQRELKGSNVHSYFRWGLDREYYRLLNRTKALIYPGINPGAWWDSKRPWEAYASGCLVLMAQPGVDEGDYPVSQICPQAVYRSDEELAEKMGALSRDTVLFERLRQEAVMRALTYFSPAPLARYFLHKVYQTAHEKGVDLTKPLSAAPVLRRAAPSVTLFAMPKAFLGNNALIQRNAIASWTRLKPRVEIILFGNEEGIAETAAQLGVRHVGEVARNEFGTPLVNALLQNGERLANDGTAVYVNADILLLDDFLPAIQRAAERFSPFLMVGQRFDLDVNFAIDFDDADWQARLLTYAKAHGKMHALTGIDYFVFQRGCWKDIPPFAIGRTAWDNWLVYDPLRRGVPVIDATQSVFAIHQNHDWSHIQGGYQAAWTGEEAQRNRTLASGTPICSISDAQWKMTRQEIVRNEPVLAWFREGMEYLKNGKAEFALGRFNDVLLLAKDLPNVQYGRAVALFQIGRLEEAAAAAQAELANRPDAVEVLNLLSRIHAGRA